MTTDKPPIMVAGRDIQSVYTIARYEIITLAEQVAMQLERDTGEAVEAQDCYPATLAYVEHHIDDWLSGLIEEICDDRQTVKHIYDAAEKRKRQDARIPHEDGGLR